MRTSNVAKKEYKQVIRDKGFILTLIIVPLALMMVFGYTFQADVENLKTIVIDEDNSEYSQDIIDAVDESEYFKQVPFSGGLSEARDTLKTDSSRAVFFIPSNLSTNLDSARTASIRVYIDSSDYTIYNVIKGASGEVVKSSLQKIVESIVEDLEIEKEEKQTSIDAIENLTDDIKELSDDTINNIEKFDVSDMSEKVSELNTSLMTLTSSLPPGSLDDVNENLRILKTDLNEYEVLSEDIDKDAHKIEEKYEDIRGRVKNLDIELKTLNRDFLSLPLDVEKQYEFGEISYFTYLTPAIMTLILFFIGVVLTTINIVSERRSKTLFRVSASPLRKIELLGGKFLVFLAVGFVEALYILLIAMFVFGAEIAGSIFSVILVLLLLMAASIGLGLLISTIVRTMKQAVMLVPLVVIPSVLISQTFSPLEVMPKFMQYVAMLSPMTYSNEALRAIMIKGSSLGSVIFPVTILVLYSVATLVLGVLIFKKRIK